MAFTNFETKEIHCKILYFGAPSSGKSTNLRSIFKKTSAEVQSGLLELHDEPGPTKFFDFLPLSFGHVQGFHLKLHLFTLPINSLYESLSSVIIRGVDGFVFVADSRIECMAETVEHLKRCRKIITDEGYNFAEIPRVFLYNKRDLPGVMPIDIMRKELNPTGYPDFEGVAHLGSGCLESLESLAQLLIKNLGQVIRP